MKDSENIFGSFGEEAEKRQTEQKKIEAAVTGSAEQEPRFRKRGTGAATITLSISEADKKRVKAYAARQMLSVSDLLHLWILAHCSEDE